jgi:hypothetical protein
MSKIGWFQVQGSAFTAGFMFLPGMDSGVRLQYLSTTFPDTSYETSLIWTGFTGLSGLSGLFYFCIA